MGQPPGHLPPQATSHQLQEAGRFPFWPFLGASLRPSLITEAASPGWATGRLTAPPLAPAQLAQDGSCLRPTPALAFAVIPWPHRPQLEPSPLPALPPHLPRVRVRFREEACLKSRSQKFREERALGKSRLCPHYRRQTEAREPRRLGQSLRGAVQSSDPRASGLR